MYNFFQGDGSVQYFASEIPVSCLDHIRASISFLMLRPLCCSQQKRYNWKHFKFLCFFLLLLHLRDIQSQACKSIQFVSPSNSKVQTGTKEKDQEQRVGVLAMESLPRLKAYASQNFLAVNQARPVQSYLCGCSHAFHSFPKQKDTWTCHFSLPLPFLRLKS